MLWKLYWYYFGDMVTFLKEIDSREDAFSILQDLPGKNLTDLINVLKTLGNPYLSNVLKGRRRNGESLIFSEIRNLPLMYERKIYKWQEGTINLDIEFCNMINITGRENEMILTPNKIYMAWPITIQGGGDIEFEARKIDELEYHQDRDLIVDKPLCCLDALLKSNPNNFREELGKAISSEDRHAVIADYIRMIMSEDDDTDTEEGNNMANVFFPESMVITASTQLLTNRTYLGSDGERLYLHIGLNYQNAGQLFEKWPDGAFEIEP